MGQRGGPNIPLDNLQLAFDPKNPKVSLSNYASIFGDVIASAIGASLAGSGTTIGLFLSALADKLNFTNLSNLNISGSLSITAWIYPRSFGGGNAARIYDKFQYSPPAGTPAGTSFYIDNSAGINAIAYNAGIVFGTGIARLNNQVTLNTWQHFAISHLGSAQTVTFYKNGASIGSSGNMLSPIAATGSSACIGNNFAGQFNFDGTIGTVRVYNKALSATEIAQIYNATKSRYGL
jgi:hypothetical protein